MSTVDWYRYYMEQSDNCEQMALRYRQVNEIDMAVFWHNASVGFKERALNMPMEM